MIVQRLRDSLNPTIEDTQSGFRRGRGIQEQVFSLLQITEKALSVNSEFHMYFIDLRKAFYKIRIADVWKGLQNRGINKNLIDCVKSLYEANIKFVRTKNETTESFVTNSKLRQGCILSTLSFSVVLDKPLEERN